MIMCSPSGICDQYYTLYNVMCSASGIGDQYYTMSCAQPVVSVTSTSDQYYTMSCAYKDHDCAYRAVSERH